MRKTSNYHKRLAAGKCGSCGQRPPEEGKVRCAQCAEYTKSLGARIRAERHAAGLCWQCGKNQHAPGKKNCESCLGWHAGIQRDRRRVAKKEALDAYGGPRCACCGEEDFRFLTIDHVDGGGNEHRRSIGKSNATGALFYFWLRKNGFPPGFQVLCYNCNCGRNYNDGVCPHLVPL